MIGKRGWQWGQKKAPETRPQGRRRDFALASLDSIIQQPGRVNPFFPLYKVLAPFFSPFSGDFHLNQATQGMSRWPTTDAKERLDEEGELEGWRVIKSAIAMAKIVAAIHQTLIPSLFTGIPPFSYNHWNEMLYSFTLNERAILIPDHLSGVLYLSFTVSSTG